MNWKEMLARAANLIEQARAKMAEYEGKEMPADVEQAVDRMLDEAEDLKKRAEQAKRAEDINKDLSEPVRSVPFDGAAGAQAGEDGQAKTVIVAAFKSYLRHGNARLAPEEAKQLSTMSDPEGGYIVPEEFRAQFILKLVDALHLRQRATVIQTSAASVGFPTFDYEGDAEWTGESKQIAEEDITRPFGKTRFTPHKLARIFRVPVELSEDAVFNVDQLLIGHFSQRFAAIEENAFINGDGVEKPLGILRTPGLNEVTLAATSFTDDDALADALIDVVYAIKQQYRGRGAWLLNRQMIRRARKLKDTTGQYLWQTSLQLGQPNTLLAFPVMESENFPFGTVAASVVALFGDFSYYWIVDRVDIAVQRLVEKYAEYDQVGYKLRKRTDGAGVLGEPLAKLVLS